MLGQTSRSRVNKAEFEVIYEIANAQQFWSGALKQVLHHAWYLTLLSLPELDDLLQLPADTAAVTLSLLDTTLRRFVSLCASYHRQSFRFLFSRNPTINALLFNDQNNICRAHCNWNMLANNS